MATEHQRKAVQRAIDQAHRAAGSAYAAAAVVRDVAEKEGLLPSRGVPKRTVSVVVPEDLYAILRRRQKRQGGTMSTFLRNLLAESVSKEARATK